MKLYKSDRTLQNYLGLKCNIISKNLENNEYEISRTTNVDTSLLYIANGNVINNKQTEGDHLLRYTPRFERSHTPILEALVPDVGAINLREYADARDISAA